MIPKKFSLKTVLLVITFTILLTCLVVNLSTVWNAVTRIIALFAPVTVGLVLAFILNVPMRPLEEKVFRFMDKSRFRFVRKLRRPICLLLAILLVLSIITLLILVVLPDLQETVLTLVNKLPKYFNDMKAWLAELLNFFNMDTDWLQGFVIDWKLVKEAGVEFVIIRLGYRGYGEEGRLVVDERAQENYEGAKAAGLMVGGYIFSQALDEQEAIEEAELVLEITADWQLDMPVAFDWEFLHLEARTDGMDKATITDCAIAFCERLKEGGLKPMLYTGVRMQTLDMQRVQEYPMWLALYSDTMSYPYWMSYWQYSCTGRVPGIQGDVDLNIFLTGSSFLASEE